LSVVMVVPVSKINLAQDAHGSMGQAVVSTVDHRA